MKKVKIMLTAITIFAVVGGALAFKAKKFNNVCFYSDVVSHDGTGAAPFCPTRGLGTIVTDAGGDIFNTTVINPGSLPEDCPTNITCTQEFLTNVEQ